MLVLADGWNNVLSGPCCACAAWSGCLSDQFFVSGHLSRRSLEQSWRSGTACSEKGSEKPC